MHAERVTFLRPLEGADEVAAYDQPWGAAIHHGDAARQPWSVYY